MDVEGEVFNGALSQYGWVPQVRLSSGTVDTKVARPLLTATCAPVVHRHRCYTQKRHSAVYIRGTDALLRIN